LHFQDPLLIQLLIEHLRPDVPQGHELLLNPYLMAGWVGLLITGLNMLPISQLDGGHVIYALFGRRSALIARTFLIVAIVYIVFADGAHMWTLMLVLVILMGVHHPPTSDDRVTLGPVRWAIGIASLAIPVLCFPPKGIMIS
jgi:hypothetical protein